MKSTNGDNLVFSYNRKAMECLKNNDFKNALSYLSKVENIFNSGTVQNMQKLYGITLNNFGCFYKRTGNPNLALNFHKKALEISSKPPIDISNLAGTHLNICAIMSQTEDHSSALSHALKALNLLKSKYLDDPSLVTTLLAAHHNAGVEYEFLTQMTNAFNIYTTGFQISQEHFGDEHPLTQSFKRSLKSTQVTRKTTSASPHHSSTRTAANNSKDLIRRSFKSSTRYSGGNAENDNKPKQDSVRFLTGERLQPMYKKEEARVKTRQRSRYDASSLVKELNGDSAREAQSFNKQKANVDKITEKEAETGEDSKILDSKDKTLTIDTQRLVEKVSTATQVEHFDKGMLKRLRNSAATLIQKYCRGFLAKRKYQLNKYTRQLAEAEKQAKIAKDKINSLNLHRSRKKIIPVIEKPKEFVMPAKSELVPIAYKEKTYQQRSHNFNSRRFPFLASLEEMPDFRIKIIRIQSCYRGWIVRKTYLKKRKAVIVIQKHVKRYQTRMLYQQIHAAIVFIQRTWKKILSKRKKNTKKLF